MKCNDLLRYLFSQQNEIILNQQRIIQKNLTFYTNGSIQDFGSRIECVRDCQRHLYLPHGPNLVPDRNSGSVRKIKSRQSFSGQKDSQLPNTTLFIKNLHRKCTKEDLKQCFIRAGPIDEITIVKTPDGEHKGYGFIVYESQNDAENAKLQFDGFKLNNQRIIVEFARRRTPTRKELNDEIDAYMKGNVLYDANQCLHSSRKCNRDTEKLSNKKLYVGNLSSDCTFDDVDRFFSQIGKIEEIRILKHEGYGHVIYKSSSDARKAISKLDGRELNNERLIVQQYKDSTLKLASRTSRSISPTRSISPSKTRISHSTSQTDTPSPTRPICM